MKNGFNAGTFERQVLEFSNKEKLFSKGDKVLAALSGGGDSVALLYFLTKYRDEFDIEIIAAHLNHSLRGEESEKDESFCVDLCRKLDVDISVSKLEKGLLNNLSGSFETEARELRRKFLIETARNNHAHKIATGHNLDDQAETLLYRILRGTGITGLSGILPFKDNLWIRPLLGVSRKDIRDYLSAMNISYRDDSSNDDTFIIRNKIRLELIPYLKNNFSPGISESLFRLSEIASVHQNFIEEHISAAIEEITIFSGKSSVLFSRSKFLSLHKAVRTEIVRKYLEILGGSGRDTEMSEIDNVISNIEKAVSSFDITVDLKGGSDGEMAAIVSLKDRWEGYHVNTDGETVLPDGSIIKSSVITEWEKPDGVKSIIISESILNKYGNLTAGIVKSGDMMTPFGMKSPVSVTHLLSQSKIPRVMKTNAVAIKAGGIVVWVPGFRSSEILRISEKPPNDKMYFLTCLNGLIWN